MGMKKTPENLRVPVDTHILSNTWKPGEASFCDDLERIICILSKWKNKLLKLGSSYLTNKFTNIF